MTRAQPSATPPRAETLTDWRPGVGGTVTGLHGHDSVAARLLDLGLTPGAPLTLLRRAPLGGVLLVRVRAFLLALRPDEAARIGVARDHG